MKTLKIVVSVLISFVMVNVAQAETTYKAFSTVKTDLQTMDWSGGQSDHRDTERCNSDLQ